MKRSSLLLAALFCASLAVDMPVKASWYRNRMSAWGRFLVMPWIHGLKAPIAVAGAATCSLLALNLLNIPNVVDNLPSPVLNDPGRVLAGIYLGGTMYAVCMHNHAYGSERPSDVVAHALFDPLLRAVKWPAKALTVIVAGALLTLVVQGSDSIIVQSSAAEYGGLAGQLLGGGFLLCAAFEYLKSLRNFLRGTDDSTVFYIPGAGVFRSNDGR